MTPELAYFLKINVAIALFYAFYRLFFHKDTFFHWRRMAKKHSKAILRQWKKVSLWKNNR